MGYIKGYKSGNVIEIYSYEKNPKATGRKHRARSLPDVVRHPRVANRTTGNIRRLRKGFIRLVRANTSESDPPALVTVTMHAVVEIEEAARAFSRFIQTLRKTEGAGFRYIAVPEFQRRGAVHYHVLFWGLKQDVIFNETPYAAWCKKTYKQPALVRRYVEWCFERSLDPRNSRGDRFLQARWAYGYLDCVPTDGSAKLAGYLAKYMSKAMQDSRLNGKRAYYASRNVQRPQFFDSSFYIQYPQEMLGGDIELVVEREFDTVWLGRANYKLFNLS